jgi:nitronate monooxygenase
MQSHLLRSLGIRYPIICGPMYPGSNPELVAAVSEAGGLGVVQPVTMTFIYGHDFREGLRYIKSLTDHPFGVNFTLMNSNKTYENRMKQWMDISIEEGVKFFLTSLGNPGWVVEKAKPHGILVYHDVTTRKFAEKAAAAGVHGLNCVNNRAGGQTGSVSPEQMVNELADLGLPLVCAGGVGDRKTFRHMLDIGYEAVQMGTRFLATEECMIQDDYKQAILDASEEDIVWTNKLAGVNSSVIRTADVERGGLRTGPVMSYLLKQRSTKNLARTALLMRSMFRYKKVVTKAGYAKFWQAGKGVNGIDVIVPAGEVVRRFAAAPEQE